MSVAIASLTCPNSGCQSPNPETHRFCQRCRTPLLKRYLWVLGAELDQSHINTLIQNRFLIKSPHIVLDTQPHQSVDHHLSPSELELGLTLARPYFKLFKWRRHLPLPYTALSLSNHHSDQTFLLLEQAPICQQYSLTDSTCLANLATAEALTSAWSTAKALRQLNWLWQMAQLWQPLLNQHVASSLLEPELLRVEGSLVRLLELQFDSNLPPLSALGSLWQQWIPDADPRLQPFLNRLCGQLIAGEIEIIEAVIQALDTQLQDQAASQSLNCAIATQIDQGPTRSRNEDACYSSATHPTADAPFAIVCDGMGGHAGGDVASNLAIQAVIQNLKLLSLEALSPSSILTALEAIIYEANDVINAENNEQQRQSNQRMGTTLVMALLKDPKLYIAHAGDSRAYYITRTGCYPLTTDHNLLSNWVEMGFGLYREMLHRVEGARLSQAVGFGASTTLAPDVQSLVIDEDCVILLCSDGLSDHQLVEQYWQTEILPILQDNRDVTLASQRLIDLANRQNGHDNVTVSLLHCTVTAVT